MINSFFDCANVRSTTKFVRKRHEFIAPYRSLDDVRFSWLENTFVKYLEDWKMISKNILGTNMRKAEEVTTQLQQTLDITTFTFQS